MSQQPANRARMVTVGLLALAVLAALIITTTGSLSGPSSTPPTPSGPLPRPPGTALVVRRAPSSVAGTISAHVRHLSGHTWRFDYTIRDTGSVPIAGFELNGGQSNLFHILGRPGWTYFGSGVCGGHHPGVLVYWSTGASDVSLIQHRGTAHFGFTVNTTGPQSLVYSLSWSAAAPQFGTVPGPAPSSFPPSAPCGR